METRANLVLQGKHLVPLARHAREKQISSAQPVPIYPKTVKVLPHGLKWKNNNSLDTGVHL